MVDAAIGGKTGVNLPEGKNLVGASGSRPPCCATPTLLATLPPRECRSGLGEMAKYHFLTGDDLLATCRSTSGSPRCVRSRPTWSPATSARAGRRGAVLNYGHTLAHALETAGATTCATARRSAIGLVYAAELARRLGRIDDARVAEHRARRRRPTTCPTTLPPGVDPDELVDADGPRQEGRRRPDVRARRPARRRGRSPASTAATLVARAARP